MKIYKYRDFSNPDDAQFSHLADAVHRQKVWCSQAEKLNDDKEFIWACDYTPTPATVDLLTAFIVKTRGRTTADARTIAEAEIGSSGRLESAAKPAITGIIDQCRAEVGLSCFGTTPDNETLWNRYGGRGAGVCIEFDVPDDLLGTQLNRVQYLPEKRLHINQLLRAFVEKGSAKAVYELALLSKPICWTDEDEIRFVSKSHSISVVLDRAKVTNVFMGDALSPAVRERIQRIVAPASIADRPRIGKLPR
jgi:hypothetical protein